MRIQLKLNFIKKMGENRINVYIFTTECDKMDSLWEN